MTRMMLCASGAVLAMTMTTAAYALEPVAPPAPPAPPPGAMPPPPPSMRMAMVMKHGPKTRAEVKARVAEQFAALDTNKDGFVTRDELPPMPPRMAEMRMHMGPAGAMPPMPPMPPMAGKGPEGPRPGLDHMFAMMDTNHDGQISKAEFDAFHSKPMHQVQVTKDKDGKTIRTERVIVMRGGDGSMGGPGGPGPSAMKMHGPGMPPMAGMAKLGGMMLALRFDALDTNHDGKLSASEIEMGALARFDRIDTNHDGTLSEAEMEAAAPRMAMRMQMRRGPGGPGMAPMPPAPPVRGPGYDLPVAPPAPPLPPVKQ